VSPCSPFLTELDTSFRQAGPFFHHLPLEDPVVAQGRRAVDMIEWTGTASHRWRAVARHERMNGVVCQDSERRRLVIHTFCSAVLMVE
jgi:hypothetical protein